MDDQEAGPSGPAQYDLTHRVSKFLDRHLVFPLLEFLSQKQIYDAAEIEAAKLELIEKTNMVDYAVDIYQGLHQTNEVRPGRAGRAGQSSALSAGRRQRTGAAWAARRQAGGAPHPRRLMGLRSSQQRLCRWAWTAATPSPCSPLPLRPNPCARP